MMLVRAAQIKDLDAILELAKITGPGLTTLPEDRELLEEKIEDSALAFATNIHSPGLEYYLFVLEDTNNGRIVGTSAIAATVGLAEAFYTYRVGTVVHNSPELNIHNMINTLYLGNDYTGSSEICTLFLHADYRKDGNGQLLSRSRFLFMAMHVQRFSHKVIAELRGISNDDGHSPFWDALGNVFFSMDFSNADALSSEGRNQFIAELMPKYPIYVSLLPKSAQDVIGQVHPHTKPAQMMLENEGFHYQGYIDIFDGGPSIEVQIENIKTVRESFISTVSVIADEAIDASKCQEYLMANTKCSDYRSSYGTGILNDDEIVICRTLANHLQVDSDDNLRLYPTGRELS